MSMTESTVEAYLRRYEERDLLRFLTAGSVDDGKSTLIGRLLYDSHQLYDDQLEALARDSRHRGVTDEGFDPALITDGLRAEREQGITIDVAYRYFSTQRRNFIICDAPGHEQYTRNMATGASHCDLAVVLVDARQGVLPQTKRHSSIASLLGIRHFVIAINKMDAVDYSEDVYRAIRRDYEGFAARMEASDVHFIPVSALKGDNVVQRGENMPWYQGEPLLAYLEDVEVVSDRNLIDFRLPIQHIVRAGTDFRGFAGTIASGVVRPGEEVVVLPAGNRTHIETIQGPQGDCSEAFAPMAVMVTTTTNVDISRGMILARPNNRPHVGQHVDAMLVWMSEEGLSANTNLLLKTGPQTVPVTIDAIRYRLDINTLRRASVDNQSGGTAAGFALNDIGRVGISAHRPICFDAYSRNRCTGAFVLIDPLTHATVAAGMVLEQTGQPPAPRAHPQDEPVSRNINVETPEVTGTEREALLGHAPATIWLTGLSGSGKSTIAKRLEQVLISRGIAAYILDGDNIRHGLNRDLGFSPEDRTENIRRIGEVARLLNDAGLIVITAFISPYRTDRDAARKTVNTDTAAPRFAEVHLATPLATCEARDPKGLYAKARAGTISGFTGIDAPYEPPANPELALDTSTRDVDTCVTAILNHLETTGTIPADGQT